MNITYQILTAVQFEHEYFQNDGFSIFKVRPDAASQKVLKNLGMDFRERHGRFSIYFEVFFGGVTRSREELLRKGLHLVFSIELIDPSFFNYTAKFDTPLFETKLGEQVFYFSNAKHHTDLLHQESMVSNRDLYAYPLRFFPQSGLAKPFGILVLKLAPGLRLLHFIKFEAQATYWRYILVSDYLQAIPNLNVIDQLNGEVFKGPIPITLPSGAIQMSFVSAAPIKLSNTFINQYQLLESSADHPLKGRVVIRALQHPNHNYHSRLTPEEGSDPKLNYSEIII